MTLQYAKDEIAKQYGFERWDSIRPNYEGRFFDEVAELYARAKWNQACALQKSNCLDAYGASQIDKEMLAIYNATKPEFKP